MPEYSLFWDGDTAGDCGPYSLDGDWCDDLFRVVFNGTGNRGVLLGWLNELEVTDGGANTATVDTGAAINYGLFYESDAAVNVNVPNGPRTDLIVVRRSWAAQTARITRIAGPGAALTQTAGVTYDIPLASVDVDGVGALTITDTREFCEFSTLPVTGAVDSDSIQGDAVTIAKLEDHTRWFTRGAGEWEPDATNPATWTNLAVTAPYRSLWAFATGVTNSMWCTFRAPADLPAGNQITPYLIFLWPYGFTGDVRWVHSTESAAASGVLANQNNATLVTWTTDNVWYPKRHNLGALTVNAGDIVHMEVYRDGGNVADTYGGPAYVAGVEFAYTADS